MRPQQSSNVPADPSATNKLIGESHWTQTSVAHVRAAHGGDYAAQISILKKALEKSAPQFVTFVSQAAAGEQGITFYTTRFGNSMAAFDAGEPPIRELLGAEASQAFHKRNAELVQTTETIISRFVPEFSNPPDEISSADPNFWRPKPAAAKSKPKAETGKKGQ